MAFGYKTNFNEGVALCGEVMGWAGKLKASASRDDIMFTAGECAESMKKIAAVVLDGKTPESVVRALVPDALAKSYNLAGALENAAQTKNCKAYHADVLSLRATLYDDAPRQECHICAGKGCPLAASGRCINCGAVAVERVKPDEPPVGGWLRDEHKASPRTASLPARQGVDPESLRAVVSARPATTVELYGDLSSLQEAGEYWLDEPPALVDVARLKAGEAYDIMHDVTSVALVGFRLHGLPARVECLVKNIDLDVDDSLAEAVKRCRAEATNVQLDALADLLEWYCDTPEAEAFMTGKAYRTAMYAQPLTPVMRAVVAVLTDLDPDTGARRVLYSRPVREAGALMLRAVTVAEWAGRCAACADDLEREDDGIFELVSDVVERVEGIIDDVAAANK